MKTFNDIKRFSFLVYFLATLPIFFLTGCTVNHHGMTMPNGTYLKDHVEYYPRGPRYQFSNEAMYLQSMQSAQENKDR
jgi:hypothetical protein